jgi:hypothetical protein
VCRDCKIPDITTCPIHAHAFANWKSTKTCAFRSIAGAIYEAGKRVGMSDGSDELGAVILKLYNSGRQAGEMGPKGK